MEIKVSDLKSVLPSEAAKPAQPVDGDAFRFALISNIEDKDLEVRLQGMVNEITMQGERIKKHKDIRDMKKYRALIKGFMNEILSHSHEFARENFLDRRGRHRVYGIIRLVDENLDKLAASLIEEESDNLTVMNMIGEIEGLLIDLLM